VRLCLDEHDSPAIAEQLRSRGHDVYAVGERTDLRALPDRQLWLHLQSERRALMTENVADFMPFVHELAAAGDDHWGIVFLSPRSLPRRKGRVSAFVERLEQLLTAKPEDSHFRNGLHWLS
jgi:hypothetical protein